MNNSPLNFKSQVLALNPKVNNFFLYASEKYINNKILREKPIFHFSRLNLKAKGFGGGSVGKCLLYKREDLSLDPVIHL